MAQLNAIVEYLDELLETQKVPEKYATNGLQVEAVANGEVHKIGFAVDACLSTFKQLKDCQLVVVHHGLFWPHCSRIAGPIATSIRYLFEHGISLYANHLPLDCHPAVGNNAQIVKLLELERREVFPPVGWMAETLLSRDEFQARVQERIGPARLLAHGPNQVQRVAVSSGAASTDMVAAAVKLGADTLLTGESGQPMFHASLEANLNVVLAGHYATETWGVRALMPLLEQQFSVATQFVDLPTGF
jgi:dinuclear metal center YbgI/SA1388 family protein